MTERAALDQVFTFGARSLHFGASGRFTTTLDVELHPGRMVDLGLVGLQP